MENDISFAILMLFATILRQKKWVRQKGASDYAAVKLQLMPDPKVGKYTFAYYFRHDLKPIRHNPYGEALLLEFDHHVDHIWRHR